MIGRLTRRMVLVVLIGLLLASAGVVAAVNVINQRDLDRQVNAVLDMLVQNGGQRPLQRGRWDDDGQRGEGAFQGMDEATPPPLPDGGEEHLTGQTPPPLPGIQDQGLPEASLDAAASAGMRNFYTIWVDSDGGVSDWVSDRADLYSDEEIASLAGQVCRSEAGRGRLGSQYYCRTDESGGQMIVVVDARLEARNLRSVLRTTALAALIEDLLLSLGAIWLIRRLVRPVDEAFEKQKQFVWDASHELKTPLAVISANAQLLEDDLPHSEELGYIRSEVERSDQLIQGLLTLARMDKAGSLPMAPFDLSRAVNSVALPFESAVFEAGKTLEIDVPEGISMTGHEEMIKQLTVNLLSNAVKYSDAGGSIRLSLRQKGDKRVISVHNSGDPIPPEAMDRIFDRFYRADASHNSGVPGSGLGLAIVQSIVRAHHGRVEVVSRAGEGTTFTVTLPHTA